VSTPGQAVTAFLAATAVAVPAGWLMHQIPILFIMPAVYGALVSEVVLRAGKRSRSLAMQIGAGVAALVGGVAGAALDGLPLLLAHGMPPIAWSAGIGYPLLMTAFGVAVAVSRVRYL
jgi:hypothetical protein